MRRTIRLLSGNAGSTSDGWIRCERTEPGMCLIDRVDVGRCLGEDPPPDLGRVRETLGSCRALPFLGDLERQP